MIVSKGGEQFWMGEEPPPYHPITALFPLVEGEEFNDLVADVSLHGVHDPVWLWQGQVIDGRNRCRAWAMAVEMEADKPEKLSLVCGECEKTVHTERALAGQSMECPHCSPVCSRCEKEYTKEGKPGPCKHRPSMVEIPLTLERRVVPLLPIREWDGRGSLVAFVLSLNLYRRHLDASLRALLAARAADMMEEEARQRQRAGLKRGHFPSAHKCADGKTKRNTEISGRSRERAAAAAKVSPRSVDNAKKVLDHGTPELVQAVEQGKVKVTRASRLADLPAEQQVAEINRQKAKASKTVAASRLRDALGGAGTDLDVARKRLEKATKKLAGYDAKRTLAAIAKAQESLAIDTARLLAESEAA